MYAEMTIWNNKDSDIRRLNKKWSFNNDFYQCEDSANCIVSIKWCSRLVFRIVFRIVYEAETTTWTLILTRVSPTLFDETKIE